MARTKSTPRRNSSAGAGIRQVRLRGARRARPATIGMTRRSKIYTIPKRLRRPKVATRRPIRPKRDSPFASQIEHYSFLMRSAAGDNNMTPGVSGFHNAAFFLSPQKADNSTDTDVEGDRTKFLGCNIKGRVITANKQPLTLRVSVVQISNQEQLITDSGFIDMMGHSSLDNYFKAIITNNTSMARVPLQTATGTQRQAFACDVDQYKILKQGYIKLKPPAGDMNFQKGFHMFVPMNNLLDRTNIRAVKEWAVAYSTVAPWTRSPATVNVYRYNYIRPIILVFELLYEAGAVRDAAKEEAFVDFMVKYSFKNTD